MIKLSVITVCRNDKDGLERTLQSVVSQTFSDFEYIVIDGGSTDGSVEIIGKFEPGITRWMSENDKGTYDAMNKGIALARGEYCLFLNAGDFLADRRTLENVFAYGYHEDILYGDMILMKGSGESLPKVSPKKITLRRMLADTLWHPVSFIKRSLFTDFGTYDLRFRIVADYEFFLRVLIGKKVSRKHIPIAISVFDETGISSNMKYREQLIRERKEAQDSYFNPLLLFCFRLYSKWRN
jgi:glycosyltransferase involved in cell wall biosynthesis